MTHDRLHAAERLHGVALQAARGELDRCFTEAVEAGLIDAAEVRDLLIRHAMAKAAEMAES